MADSHEQSQKSPQLKTRNHFSMLSFLKLIGRPLFRILFSVEYHGLENVPDEGAVILAGNHPSYLDPVLVSLPIKRAVRFMAWDALFNVPLLGPLIRALGAFPVDITRGKGEAAYLEACRVLEQGEALGIFPEGQRSERGPMGELRMGTARLAVETGAPIVPVTIGGASRAWPKWRLLPRPAKIIVRYHRPVYVDEAERAARHDDRDFHREIMQAVAASINRSLTPALRESESFERWYRQPPSHIRLYEWVPLAAAAIATLAASFNDSLRSNWQAIWLPPAAYYLYLTADLLLIKPGRLAKWVRNSMPIWLILIWHYYLTRAIDLPVGAMNGLLGLAALGTFFSFFYEDYLTLQKFVRGLIMVYYLSLALLLGWPHHLGTFAAVLFFIVAFCLYHRTVYYWVTVSVAAVSLAAGLILKGPVDRVLLIYLGLAVAALGYLQTFIAAAYDIRRAGDVTVQEGRETKRRSQTQRN